MIYSKAMAKEERARRLKLENIKKILENNLTDNVNKLYELLKFKNKCQHYEGGGKPSKLYDAFTL